MMQKILWKNIMSVFYKKKKLIVCGCSYSDNYATREGLDNFEVYGSLLADKLDMELVNLSLCGFGNKGIFTSLIDSILNQKPPKDIGLVIAQWSEFQRVDGFVKTMHKSTEVNVALFFKYFFSSSETVFCAFCFFLTYKVHINFLTGKNKTMLKRIIQKGS